MTGALIPSTIKDTATVSWLGEICALCLKLCRKCFIVNRTIRFANLAENVLTRSIEQMRRVSIFTQYILEHSESGSCINPIIFLQGRLISPVVSQDVDMRENVDDAISTAPSDSFSWNMGISSTSCSQISSEAGTSADSSPKIANIGTELLENLKRIYALQTSKEGKLKILALLPESWPQSLIQKNFPCTRRAVEIAKQKILADDKLSSPPKRKGKQKQTC